MEMFKIIELKKTAGDNVLVTASDGHSQYTTELVYSHDKSGGEGNVIPYFNFSSEEFELLVMKGEIDFFEIRRSLKEFREK